jgi:hypothetical protein
VSYVSFSSRLSLTCQEIHPTLGGQRLGHERLGAAGRAVQQHSAGRGDLQTREELRVLQRPLHHLGGRGREEGGGIYDRFVDASRESHIIYYPDPHVRESRVR